MSRQLLDNAPPPTEDPVVGPGGRMAEAWARWFARIPDTLSAIPSRINAVELAASSSSVAATDFSGGTLRAGLYRATYYARLASGALTVTFQWTDGGSLQSWLSTDQSGTIMFRSDAGASVTYAASYAGSGTYSLDVTLERVKA